MRKEGLREGAGGSAGSSWRKSSRNANAGLPQPYILPLPPQMAGIPTMPHAEGCFCRVARLMAISSAVPQFARRTPHHSAHPLRVAPCESMGEPPLPAKGSPPPLVTLLTLVSTCPAARQEAPPATAPAARRATACGTVGLRSTCRTTRRAAAGRRRCGSAAPLRAAAARGTTWCGGPSGLCPQQAQQRGRGGGLD